MEKRLSISPDKPEVDMKQLRSIERGIEDVENRRELPLDEAMRKVREIRGERKQIRA